MMKGMNIMKYLKIKENRVIFLNEKLEEKLFDTICKEDILFLIKKCFEDDFEYDSYDNESIKNTVHNIIYKDISNKIELLIADKVNIEETINNEFKDAWDKYCV